MIVLFAYDFPHRKTNDFLTELFLSGYREVLVLAAPYKVLKTKQVRDPIAKSENSDLRLSHPRLLSVSFGFEYHVVDHGDHVQIWSLLKGKNINLAFIAGARILSGSVIQLFSQGVVNFHPGKLPQTAGLDAFWRSIHENVPLGVTCHLIDERIDAGKQIGFLPLEIRLSDSFQDAIENLYQTQLQLFRDVINNLSSIQESVEIAHNGTNQPMTLEEKVECYDNFESWKLFQFLEYKQGALREACERGNIAVAETIVRKYPHLLKLKDKNGWSPIIVAAFNHQIPLVKFFLDEGADPNDTGKKGTTVLMYAKTKLLEQENPRFDLLELLIDNGADARRRDMYGKTVLDYCTHSPQLSDFFAQKKNTQ